MRFRSLDRCRFGVLALVVTSFAAATQCVAPARAEAQRIALLIQNDAYREGDPATTVGEDASTLAALLKKDGFEVELKRNLNRQDMQASLAAFLAKAREKSVALLYYRGVGIQVSRQNYLVPVDASIWSDDDVRRDGTSLDRVMGDLDRRGAGVKIAIVDAARPNPFERRFRAYAAGLAPLSSPQGSLVIFAQALSQVAAPSKAPVSLFMSDLVKQIEAGGDAETAFARTREAVAKASEGRQIPWVSSTLADPFSFAMRPPAVPDPSQPAVSAQQGKPEPKPSIASPPPAPARPPSVTKPPPEKPAAPTAAAQAPSPQPLRPGSTFSDCKRCPGMKVLAAATFRMGSGTTPFDRPVHDVSVKRPFAIGLFAVTRDEWALCVENGACPARSKDGAGDGRAPMVEVDWSDAETYAAFLARKSGKKYRLPTEAEWEYAARGGATTAFAWGDAPGTGHANCTDCGGKSSRAEIAPVGRFPANGFGLYDMAGNVAEWLQDCWTLTYRGAPTDGSAPFAASCKMRVVRGGSFATSSAYVKPTARFRAESDTKSASIGFRVARDLE